MKESTNEEIAIEIKKGNTELIPQLWEQVENLVKWKAAQIIFKLGAQNILEFDDFYNSGYIAMIKALDTYKPNEGPFANWFIFYLKTEFSIVGNCRSPRQEKDPLNHHFSIDAAMPDSEDPFSEVIPDPAAEAAFENTDNKIYIQQLSLALCNALESIPEDQRAVISTRFLTGRTQKETAEKLNISKQRCYLLEKKGLRGLRKGQSLKALAPYAYPDYYKHSGQTFFFNSGFSVQEDYLIRKEKYEERY